LTGPSAGRAQVQVFAGTSAEVQARIDAGQCSVMAVVGYGSGAAGALKGVPLSVAVPLEPMAGSPDRELWFSKDRAQYGSVHGVAYARSDDAVFGHLSIAQLDETFEHTAQRAYAQLLCALDELGCPHLLRVWNYFPSINADEQGMERYQRFCIGRHRAFEHHYRNRMIERLPAASAIGTRDSNLIIYFIAARDLGQHLENPRQVSAYCYPKKYGPASPTFSRASVKHWA
jgi:chorismate lyase/3-hydroxybenzoate synthase